MWEIDYIIIITVQDSHVDCATKYIFLLVLLKNNLSYEQKTIENH